MQSMARLPEHNSGHAASPWAMRYDALRWQTLATRLAQSDIGVLTIDLHLTGKSWR